MQRFRVKCQQYADDSQFYLPLSSVFAISQCLVAAGDWKWVNQLNLNLDKTSDGGGSPYDLMGVEHLTLIGVQPPLVPQVCSLGLLLDLC